jgi:t-SNARE complex subunit (syntaxin)
MDQQEKIVELLQEIRDDIRAHTELVKRVNEDAIAFREEAMQGQKEAMRGQKKAIAMQRGGFAVVLLMVALLVFYLTRHYWNP